MLSSAIKAGRKGREKFARAAVAWGLGGHLSAGGGQLRFFIHVYVWFLVFVGFWFFFFIYSFFTYLSVFTSTHEFSSLLSVLFSAPSHSREPSEQALPARVKPQHWAITTLCRAVL